MHGIWGWLGLANQPANPDLLQPMSRNADFAFVGHGAGALAVDRAGSVARDGACIAAVSGGVTFSGPAMSDVSPAQRALASWKRDGMKCLAQMHGAFSIAIMDTSARTLLLAVDRMGIRRLCFARGADTLVFGPNCDVVLGHPAIRRAVDPQGIFNYLYAHMVPAPGTIFSGVEKLLPAQCLTVADGKTARDFYWQAAWGDEHTADFGPKAAEFRTLLESCVRDALGGTGRAGAFLSGGTDSSTISGVVTKLSGEPADTFSIGFEAEGFDEIEYARIAAKHFGTRPHEYYAKPSDVVDAIPLIASAYDEPFGNASAVPTYLCALQARQAGIDVMLAGDGGDEIFGGNVRYARQVLFERYGLVPRLLRKGLVEPLTGRVPGGESIPGFRKVRSFVQQAAVPLPDRLDSYNHLRRTPLESVFTSEFLRSVNPEQPAELQREVYFRTASNSPINRMLHLDWKQTLADNDLVKVGRMCELAGVEVRYPLLDERMVAFAAALPPSYKVRNGKLRWFFKEALRGFLPDAILSKSKHGFGLPFGLWMQADPQLFDLAHSSLRAFRSRGYMRDDYVDRLVDAHQSEHATYYGAMIWVIMMLEQWLQQHP